MKKKIPKFDFKPWRSKNAAATINDDAKETGVYNKPVLSDHHTQYEHKTTYDYPETNTISLGRTSNKTNRNLPKFAFHPTHEDTNDAFFFGGSKRYKKPRRRPTKRAKK